MNKKITIFKLLVLSVWTLVAIGQPKDNPYTTAYGNIPDHWTNALPWKTVVNVTSYGAVANDNQDDLKAIQDAINAVSAAKGGVVYFPAGTYQVSDNIEMKDGVILRGETPSVSNAKDSMYSPPSKLVFPKYIFDTTANNGRGTPNNTAFKAIQGQGKLNNVGIVNLDINRAMINLHPGFDYKGMVTHAGGTTENWQPADQNYNCIIFGVRTNNVAFPRSNVPDTSGANKMRHWQRYFFEFAAYIDVYFAGNLVVANNRCGDKPTDNFFMPNYKVRNRCTGCTNYKSVGKPSDNTWNAENFIPVTDRTHAYFDYSAHYGISVNRDKLVWKNGVRTIQPMIWYPSPQQEPSLYAKNFEILDNWVYKTNRVGLWIAGQDMVVKRNHIRDTGYKNPQLSGFKKVVLNTIGTEIQRNNSATYENRGIDFGGSGLVIDSNDLHIRIHNFVESQYATVDGEGIMDQGNGGGTRPNGLIVTNNTINSDRNDCTNPTIGLYRTGDINNITYANNMFTGNSGCIMIDADAVSNPAFMSNILVENNSGIKRAIIRGSKGGYNAVFRNNKGTGSGATMTLSCYVKEYGNQNLSLASSGCVAATVDTSVFVNVAFVSPSKDTLVSSAPASYTLRIKTVNGMPDSVVIYLDAVTRLGQAVKNGNFWEFTWTPSAKDDNYQLYAFAYGFDASTSTNMLFKTAPVQFKVEDGNPLTNSVYPIATQVNVADDSFELLKIYPNPGNGLFHSSGLISGAGWVLLDMSGHSLKSGKTVIPNEDFDFRGIPCGLYMLRFEINGESAWARINILP